MRIASRILGALLAIAGLVFTSFSVVFLVTFRPESVLAGPQWGKRLTGGLPRRRWHWLHFGWLVLLPAGPR
jgi:hypothetical protein